MTADGEPTLTGNIEQIFGSAASTPVSDELKKLSGMLAPLCPSDSLIKFEYDGTLRLHIDVRRLEDLTTVERLLPTVSGGIFQDVHRGLSEKHSFFHRLTAVVRR